MGKVHAFQKLLFCHWLVLITNFQSYQSLMDSEMADREKPFQNQKRKRSQSNKIGRLKFNQSISLLPLPLLRSVLAASERFLLVLKESFNFEQSLIDRAVCVDEIDRQILQVLYEAGSPDLLPKDLQSRLEWCWDYLSPDKSKES